ncbi:hypothetical protein ACIPN8_38500 [Streptomyces sp. NPDC086082]|uniref:hypothetical protein n=1 Tax=Streptomyces sp. NPDC086082 TaxID=3365750 RepID=UPI0037F3A74E
MKVLSQDPTQAVYFIPEGWNPSDAVDSLPASFAGARSMVARHLKRRRLAHQQRRPELRRRTSRPEGGTALCPSSSACPQGELCGWTAGAAHPGAPFLEVGREPTTGEQAWMSRKRGDRGKSEGKRSPWRLHSNRPLGTASVDEARLEHVRCHEIDGAQPSPFEVQFSSVREVQPPQRDRRFAVPVHNPAWLGVTRRLTSAGGISDGGARQ